MVESYYSFPACTPPHLVLGPRTRSAVFPVLHELRQFRQHRPGEVVSQSQNKSMETPRPLQLITVPRLHRRPDSTCESSFDIATTIARQLPLTFRAFFLLSDSGAACDSYPALQGLFNPIDK